MYSFLYTSKFSQQGMDEYLLHILFDSQIVESRFIQVPIGTGQESLDTIANEIIDLLEGF